MRPSLPESQATSHSGCCSRGPFFLLYMESACPLLWCPQWATGLTWAPAAPARSVCVILGSAGLSVTARRGAQAQQTQARAACPGCGHLPGLCLLAGSLPKGVLSWRPRNGQWLRLVGAPDVCDRLIPRVATYFKKQPEGKRPAWGSSPSPSALHAVGVGGACGGAVALQWPLP